MVRITPIYKPWSERPFRKGKYHNPIFGDEILTMGFLFNHLLHIQRLGFHPRNLFVCLTSWVSERGNLRFNHPGMLLQENQIPHPPMQPPLGELEPGGLAYLTTSAACAGASVATQATTLVARFFTKKKGVGEEEQGWSLQYRKIWGDQNNANLW